MLILLINTDGNGNLKWAKIYGSTGEDGIGDLKKSNDNGLIFTGWTSGFNALIYDLYLIKTDSLGKSGCNEMDVTDSIIVLNVPTITTIPPTQVDSGWAQDTVNVIVVPQTWTEQTICSCNLTASFTYTINNSQLTCSNASQNSTNWLWSFGDGDTSILQNPVHTYSVNGSYIVCLTASDSFGCSDSICYTLNINTAVSEIENGNLNMSVYPNPATENFTVETELKQAGVLTITVLNLLGENVHEINEKAGTGKYKKTMITEKISKGIYFLRMKTNEKTAVKKIVIQ